MHFLLDVSQQCANIKCSPQRLILSKLIIFQIEMMLPTVILALAGPGALDNSRKTVIKYMDLHASERNRLSDNQFDNIFQHFERCNE